MENLKRKYITCDTNFLKSNKPFKKYKFDGLTYECQAPINWYEVKVILDATAVDKYLNNKKCKSEISNKKNAVPNAPKPNKMFSTVFSQMNDVMVKLEASEYIPYDDSSEKQYFEFVDVSIKHENNSINDDDEFEECIYDDFHCQNYTNHPPFTEKLAEGIFKNELTVSDRCDEEITTDSEFNPNYDVDNRELINTRKANLTQRNKISEDSRYDHSVKKENLEFVDIESSDHDSQWQNHQKHAALPMQLVKEMSYNETPVLDVYSEEITVNSNFVKSKRIIDKKNEVARSHMPTQRITRSNRRKKKCQNCDTCCDYKAIKRSRMTPRVNKRSIVNSNRKKTSKFSSKRNVYNSLVNSQTPKSMKKYYHCDNCNYKSLRKNYLSCHIKNRHSWPSWQLIDDINFMCSECGSILPQNAGDRMIEKHRELCRYSIRYPCMFCPKTFYLCHTLTQHLTVHIDAKDEISILNIVKEIAKVRNIMKEINDARFEEKIKKKIKADETIEDFNHYLKGIHSIIKPICFKCMTTVPQQYEICVKCDANLAFQCLKCYQYFLKYFIAWDHVTRICKNRILAWPVNRINNNENMEADIDNPRQLNEPSYILDHAYYARKKRSSYDGQSATYICYVQPFSHPEYLLDHEYALKIESETVTRLERLR